MSMMPPGMMIAMTVTMMVAMMLPSIAPNLWRYHRELRATRTPHAAVRTTLFAAGYASVWATITVALLAVSAALSPMGMASPADPPFTRWVGGAIVLCAGALQRSRWKATRLARCREACVPARVRSSNVVAALRDGCQLGANCVASCSAPMAVLFAAGLMDPRMMLLITGVITAERVAPGGVHVARLTGGIALVAGLMMCVRAI
jgi:predicted metal-binding membrane protein